MHPHQRANREPAYTYQFIPLHNQILELNAQYKTGFIEWEISYQKKLSAWHKEHTRLSELAASGTTIDRYILERQEKGKGELALSKSGKELQKAKLTYTISLAIEKLFGMLSDIQDDLEGKYITLEQYKQYLSLYKVAIDSGNNLHCFQKPPADRIKEEIAKHLPTGS